VAVRCLIVDDNRSFLRAARTLLEREGLTIRVATTSAEVRTTSSSRLEELGRNRDFACARYAVVRDPA
jgi:CheY-like chemotaxis protein